MADLEAIEAFIARSSPHYGAMVVRQLVSAVGQLAAQPHSGRIVPELSRDDVRELVLYNFRVV